MHILCYCFCQLRCRLSLHVYQGGRGLHRAGARPTNSILIEFEIRSKYGVFYFKICPTNRITKKFCTRHDSYCRDMCKISLWSVEYILNQNTANFGRISNLIIISLVGRAPGPRVVMPNRFQLEQSCAGISVHMVFRQLKHQTTSWKLCPRYSRLHGPLTRYVKLWVAHAPGMPGTFSPPPTTKETAS